MSLIPATHDASQASAVRTATFPVLSLSRNNEVSIAMLQKHAEDTMGMMHSHRGLRRLTRLLELIPANSKVLSGLFLEAQNVTDVTLLEVRYPASPPFPNIDAQDFPKDVEEEWFDKFHDVAAGLGDRPRLRPPPAQGAFFFASKKKRTCP